MGLLSTLAGGNGASELTEQEAALARLTLEVAALSDNEEIYQERIAELELAIEDQGWNRLGGAVTDFQFSRTALDDIIHQSRLYYLKNPIIKRPVDLQAVYVWGQGVSIFAEGAANDVVQAFLADSANRRSFTGHDALMDQERRLRVEGNVVYRFFKNPSTGRLRVRRLPIDEIRDIVYNPEDHDEPWFYIRKFHAKGNDAEDQTVAYPDWRYARERRIERRKNGGRSAGVTMDTLAEYPEARIEWDTPVMHKRSGAFGDMDFGVPETYAAIDWAKAYKSALEDYKKTVKSLATWAWKMKLGGGQAQLNAAASALGTTFGSDDTYSETNPAPVRGSLFAYTGENDLRAIDVSKAVIDPDGFRRLMLMAASSMGMPEVYYGAAEGTFATAKAMDRPTELQFRDRQNLWGSVYTDVLTMAIEAAAEAPGYDGLTSDGYDEFNGQMKLRAGGQELKLHIEVDFPPILQKDVQEFMQALTTFTTQNGQAIQTLQDGPTLYRMALTALGVDNVEEIIELFYPKDGSKPKNKPIETFTAPPGPADVNQDGARAPSAMTNPASPTGSQPVAQGPAGADNRAPSGRAGAYAAAPSGAHEADPGDEESKARIEFMQALIEMRREAQAARQTTD